MEEKLLKLQQDLRWSSQPEDVKHNRELIDKVRQHFEAQLKVVRALAGANRELCKHPHMHHYSCMGDSSSSCDDCGYSS